MKVLFIAGWDRSGSTLLDLVLGSIDGFTGVGELGNVWKRGIIERRTCGCGQPLSRCEVWSPILTSVFGHFPTPEEARRILRFRRDHTRLRHTWRILRAGDHDGLDPYLALLSRLYRAIGAWTGARVVVDSSKDASDAAALIRTPDVEVSVVHLVRDPRASAYSVRHRPKVQTDTEKASTMRRQGVVHGTLNWLAWNGAAELVARRIPERSLVMRYEDLVAEPVAAVRSIVELVGEGGAELPFVTERTALVRPVHTVSGNPTRFASGPIDIRLDDEWSREQPPVDRWMATTIAGPLMPRYGYPLSVGRAAAR